MSLNDSTIISVQTKTIDFPWPPNLALSELPWELVIDNGKTNMNEWKIKEKIKERKDN